MKSRRIDRFRRPRSDAHLLTPPDTDRFQATTSYDRFEGSAAQLLVHEITGTPVDKMAQKRVNLSEVIQHVCKDQKLGIERIETWETLIDNTITFQITRRPKLSPKLLANLTPLQRQRLRQSGQPCQ